MKRIRVILGILAILAAVFFIYFILSGEKAVLTHPKGIIARCEWHLIAKNYSLMFLIIIPTFIALFIIAWKYRAQNIKIDRDSKRHGIFREWVLWILPSLVVAPMVFITWTAAHQLDPYQPLKSEIKPLTIQVVALDWKWLFIYPEQKIATINFVQFPEGTPIHFILAADGSPMNSFWLPELSGQIYAMTGMTTHLHIMADGCDEYRGRAAEINGKGFADMTFVAKSTSLLDFEEWVSQVKQSPLQLSESIYNELVEPSQNHSVILYSHVENNLFDKIVMKWM